jgi:hypothetical protein
MRGSSAEADGGWRFLPRLDRVDGVPTVFLVVPQAAMDGDPSANAWRRQRMSGYDLRGSQRAASLHQPHTPPSAAATAHPEDPTDDSGSHTAMHREREDGRQTAV